ncbi:ABC transporter ATP-binding protein [Haladaptatus sp. DYF46]|uniref:ABC transporter ATP-binding protein n=1 Tax=Haladaptatus sp. DYF46 TaxID=2886041 RepID=UPI001E43AD8D|nr:ABC transporter ATP-binding protein [Haladaptatus sp. DYF46]
MAVLELQNLTKQFGGTTVVDNINLHVEQGEVFGFLGPNGAGKSTTINMLLDFVRPTSGDIAVFGQNPTLSSRAVRERIGVLPEGYNLYDRLSARKHITLAIEMKRSNENPDEILQRVGLTANAEQPVGNFSKGMQQRLALGMALVGRPDLLILDEPTSGLDPNWVHQLREIIRDEADRGATIFFSSHVLEQVEAVCDRIAIMQSGEIVALDSLEGLRETTGQNPTLVLSVESVPKTHTIDTIEGVEDVMATDDTFHIVYSDSRAKAAAISTIEEAGITITDIGVKEASLEQIFTKHTLNGETA